MYTPDPPSITIVTVCRNSARCIEDTLRSVLAQDYPNLEYIVIDGGSTDGTLEILQRYRDRISALISEPDRGVYDAMNKGIDRAKGEFLLFMNAGDIFDTGDVLLRAARAARAADAHVVYGDFAYAGGKYRVVADVDRGVFNHQCMLYRRSLHEVFGRYCDVQGLTAADYLFFMLLRASGRVTFRKADFIFAIVDPHGISAGAQTFLQVALVDALLGRRGRYATALRIAVHPIYDAVRKTIRRRL